MLRVQQDKGDLACWNTSVISCTILRRVRNLSAGLEAILPPPSLDERMKAASALYQMYRRREINSRQPSAESSASFAYWRLIALHHEVASVDDQECCLMVGYPFMFSSA